MLQDLLSLNVFGLFFVFARIGSIVMLLPTIGEAFVAAQARLALAMLISLIVWPLIPDLPAVPDSALMMMILIMGELVIGLFIGTVLRMVMSAANIAGMVIAQMSSLANALVQDATAQQQASITGNFLTLSALLIIFTADLHLVMLRGLAESYIVFPPAVAPPTEDFAMVLSKTMAMTFTLAMKMAAPFVAVGTLFYVGMGLMARLMPQVQIFFVSIPVNVAIGLLIMGLAIPSILRLFKVGLENSLSVFQVY